MRTHEKIRLLRENQQWTQEEMAAKLNMSTGGYAKIERGDTHSNLKRLEQIAKVFDIDIMELLAYGEEKQIQFNNVANNETVSNTFFVNGSDDLQSELSKLQLMLSHKDEIIESLKTEIALLREINRLQTQNPPNIIEQKIS